MTKKGKKISMERKRHVDYHLEYKYTSDQRSKERSTIKDIYSNAQCWNGYRSKWGKRGQENVRKGKIKRQLIQIKVIIFTTSSVLLTGFSTMYWLCFMKLWILYYLTNGFHWSRRSNLQILLKSASFLRHSRILFLSSFNTSIIILLFFLSLFNTWFAFGVMYYY